MRRAGLHHVRHDGMVGVMAKLASAELWGGPFDGVTVDCVPVPSILTVYYDPATKRLDWTADAIKNRYVKNPGMLV